MWFWLAIIALLCWSGSDLFSKIGCNSTQFIWNNQISWNKISKIMPLS